MPDIYLILLDGYPRSDTQLSEFHLDNRPFLSTMESHGFDVAKRSRSNYNATVLTVASMMSGKQVPQQLPDPPESVPAQYRALRTLINGGVGLRPFREAGYEVVSMPNAYTASSLVSADRVIDYGHLTYFEMHLLSAGILRSIVGGPVRENYRSQITGMFETLATLARERSGPPKIVFAHLLVPHMPVVFTRTGQPAEPFPCYPACTLFEFGDQYGDAIIEPMREQLEWVNSEVERTAVAIQEQSQTPPVIIFFSDHGMRHDPADQDEMFRSFFMAAAPGNPGLFPDDMTPVTLLGRLASAYGGATMPLSSEEPYWIDTRRPDGDMLITLRPWPAD